MSASSKSPRAVLYHRVSTLDQNQAGAREELRAAATARGMTITLEVEETGSGARNDRPGLAKLMHAAQRGEIYAVSPTTKRSGCSLSWHLTSEGS